MIGDKSKIIVIVLDGAYWKVVNSLVKEDKMPNINYLNKNGTSGTLLFTIPPISAPAK